MFRYSLRMYFLVTFLFATYLGAQVSVRPVELFDESSRLLLIPNLPPLGESALLFVVACCSILTIRSGVSIQVQYDWRRGLLRALLVVSGLALAFSPFAMRCLLLFVELASGV